MKTYTDNTRGLYFDVIQGDYPVYTKSSPTTYDYNRGYINRYFAKKINVGTIYEVSGDSYNTIIKGLYSKINLIWRITGSKTDVYQNKVKIYSGVKEDNQSAIKNAEKVMPGLSGVLKNPLEFYK
jgi:hypothetical protein